MPRRDIETWMWAEACESLARAERLHRQFFRLGVAEARPVWEPPVDVIETEDELWIIAALPGVEASQLEVGVADGSLVIAGIRSAPLRQAATIHRLEIPQGRFERRILLPAGRFELGRRDLAHGCLTLVLLKRP
jgi:HSP20 family molecular chaperone IbpA